MSFEEIKRFSCHYFSAAHFRISFLLYARPCSNDNNFSGLVFSAAFF